MPLTFASSVTVLHGILAVVLMGSLALTGLKLSRLPQGGAPTGAIRAAWVALISALLVNVAGGYSYTVYRLSAPTSPRSVILQKQPWVHKVLFENMEYLSLAVPLMIAVLVTALTVYGARLTQEPGLPMWLGRLVYASLCLVFLMATCGFIPSVIAFVQ